MISFEDAQSVISKNGLELGTHTVSTLGALGRILSQDIHAPINLPSFDNSAVDGFAVNTKDLAIHKNLLVQSFVRAVGQERGIITPGTAVKIMTGAPLPQGADAIVMKEDVALVDNEIICSKPVSMGDHVRLCGEDLKAGARVSSVGTIVTPQLIGTLYGLGIDQVRVFRSPKIKIISTGDELVMAGQSLKFGEGYYLVGPMLLAQCRLLGVEDVSFTLVGDDALAIDTALGDAGDADIILLTGGMSKGDYDLVRPALCRARVWELFYEGLWRPGKPLYFGAKHTTRIFGLPGNPVAAFVCFWVFVRQLIAQAMKADYWQKLSSGIVVSDFTKKAGFTFFARAVVNGNHEISLVGGQGSHQVYNLSQANGLCVLPAHQSIVKAGQVLQYYPI